MTFLCKNCWLAHGPDTLLARCRICDTNARVKRLDPLRAIAQPFDGSDGKRPDLLCKFHREERLEIFCGTCKTAISPRALLSGRSVIAVMGSTASGKTSLLWVLRERMRNSTDLPVQIRQTLGDSDEQLTETVRTLIEQGQLSVTPKTDAVARNYAWELVTTQQWPQESAIVAFHDAGGETWRDLETMPREENERLYRYLDLVGSAIVLIDGERVLESILARRRGERPSPAAAEAQAQELGILQMMADRFSRRERIAGAVVISKADVLWDDWNTFHPDSGKSAAEIDVLVRQVLEESGRNTLLRACQDLFATVGYFAISAYGRHLVSYPTNYESLRPGRVEEPLLALIRGEGQPANG